MRVFVFGSNVEGRHGAGAALTARKYHSAMYGQTEGLQGRAYGIITIDLRKHAPRFTMQQVARGIRKFLRFAENHPGMQFELTPIGCGLAGFTPAQIAPLFAEAPKNVELPDVFKEYISDDFMMERMQ